MDKLSVLKIKTIVTNNKKYSYLIVFSISIIIRLVPEIIASPYPIGYDVINYYLPILTNFDNHWPSISNQNPIYISLLHIITTTTQVDPRIVITSVAVLVFGLLSLVILSISKNIFHLDNIRSIFLTIFVIVQVSILRTSWDLHKDMLAITILFFSLLYVTRISYISKMMSSAIVALSIVSILTDKMIGFLLSLSLLVYSLIKREKKLTAIGIFTILIFSVSIIVNFGTITDRVELARVNSTATQIYNPVNLIVLFLVMNVILLPTGIIGLLKSKNNIFKIPLFISLIGSFSWIVSPNMSAFLPDRWIVIFSIFLSLFSGYGFIVLVENKIISIFHKKLNNYLIVLTPFLFLGAVFMISPNGSYFNVYNLFHENIGQFVPMTMQYNSISLQESKSLLSLIDWMNNNLKEGSFIVGSKHIRGWMELELENRTFQYFDNITGQGLKGYKEFYLVNSNTNNVMAPTLNNYSSNLFYKNTDFSLYHLQRYTNR